MPALIDSGAEVTVISEELAMELGLPITESASLQCMGLQALTQKFVGICDDTPQCPLGMLSFIVPIWVARELGRWLDSRNDVHSEE